MNRADTSQLTKKVCGLFHPPIGQITEEEQRQTVGSFSACMLCKDTSIGQAAVHAVSETYTLQQASVTPTPHPSVSMRTQGEMGMKVSLMHMRSGRAGKVSVGKKREKTEWEIEKIRTAREKEEYKIG